MNTRTIQKAAVCIAALSAATAFAADESVEARLEKLEGEVNTLKSENTELRSLLGADEDEPLKFTKSSGKSDLLQVEGYLQVQAGFGDAPDSRFNALENDSFTVRRARIGVSGKFMEDFEYKIQTDVGGTGAAIRAQQTDGYINWSKYEPANIKVGQFKTPFGYEQLTSDTKTLTIERSLPNDHLTFSRQIGLAVHGKVADSRIRYTAGLFNGNNVNIGTNDDDNFMYAGRLEGTVVKTDVADQPLNWDVAVNGVISHDTSVSRSRMGFAGNTFSGERRAAGIDTQVTWGRFGLYGELLFVNFQPDPGVAASTDFDAIGGYVAGTFDILPKKLQAVLKYETADTEGVGTIDGDVYTAGLTYFVRGNNIKLMANYLYGEPDAADSAGRLLFRAQVAF